MQNGWMLFGKLKNKTMKPLFIILILATSLLSCDNNKQTENKDVDPVVESNHYHTDTGKIILSLNNGAKWKVDSITMQHVALLQKIVSGSRKNRLEDFFETSTQMQMSLGKMVSECKMKGADHTALHHWLLPLLGMVKELKASTTVEKASAISTEIEKHINLFTQYFERS